MKIILSDKYGIEREIILSKEISNEEEYINFEIRVGNEFYCYIDIDNDELENALNILKNKKNG